MWHWKHKEKNIVFKTNKQNWFIPGRKSLRALAFFLNKIYTNATTKLCKQKMKIQQTGSQRSGLEGRWISIATRNIIKHVAMWLLMSSCRTGCQCTSQNSFSHGNLKLASRNRTPKKEKMKDRRSLIECYDCGQVSRLVRNVCEKKQSWNNKNNNKRLIIC